ncbi:hypothetical protein WJX73_007771 [Symbiochloris irregularis]|uniref:Uncharacterized protein n=1 Tax=Symbiochloris irregularis TaxID=706552 RepID=A0AAW1PM33_9CHLO
MTTYCSIALRREGRQQAGEGLGASGSQPMPNGASGISRPFVVAVVLLLLFLSIQTDWSPPRGQAKRDPRILAAAPEALLREATKEKIIFDLSVSNEKLEKDNFMLKQHLLDLRSNNCTPSSQASKSWPVPKIALDPALAEPLQTSRTLARIARDLREEWQRVRLGSICPQHPWKGSPDLQDFAGASPAFTIGESKR